MWDLRSSEEDQRRIGTFLRAGHDIEQGLGRLADQPRPAAHFGGPPETRFFIPLKHGGVPVGGPHKSGASVMQRGEASAK